MIGTIVYKMSGSGNDFVFVDGRASQLSAWPPERIRAVCDRHTGVGADGFVVVEPGSVPDAVRFHFFNNDGGRAAMCGNGALCATRIAAHLELVKPDGMVLETDAGAYRSRCVEGDGERAELVLGDVTQFWSPQVRLQAGEREARLVHVGVPHLVVLVDQVAAVPIMERGRALRFDPALGPPGANVNFVSRGGGGGDTGGPAWAMRTYERGVEGETLACGTGAVAAASVLALSGHASLPLEVQTASGRLLRVSGTPAGPEVRGASLIGEGRLVFRAILGDMG
ncbi:MAG: diaminopimelate epimerase [Gemmatimonadetes bacterium]|nr:diaminopimelate epimerase [Gemmatimonadota bacterium]MBI2614522.1 diaminopimelate epimerase [Gemmatimonadota bacterium]